MTILRLALPLLLVTAATYLSPVDAKTVSIPWGLKPSVLYFIKDLNPAYKPPKKPHAKPHAPPHKTPHKAPHKAPTKAPVKPVKKPVAVPTALKKPPPPPSPVSPPPAPASLPPPAPVVAGRRSLLVSKYIYPYRYLVEYSKSAHTYKFKTLKIKRGTKLLFRVGVFGSKGHHGLARTSHKYRCGHPLKTYFKPTLGKKSFTVTLPHKGTYNFYDPTFSPVPVYNKKHKVVKHVSKQWDCQHYFISLSVVVS